jgi:16S rRNA G1207 methylase RsmC
MLTDDPSPAALVKRAERALSFGEQIMAKAIEEEDFRLALQAVDRARASLEQLMKVHGLLQPDGATVVVNAEEMTERKALAVVVNAIPSEKRRAEALELWLRFLTSENELPITIDARATDTALAVTDNRALAAG